MPNRILREGILTSERVARLGWPDEVFYRRLMSVVDDFGRYHANPKLLRAACYPLLIDKVSDSDIGKWLTACVNAALITVYEARAEAADRKGSPVNGGEPADGSRGPLKPYLQLLDFRQQARADKSKFPAPDGECIADATQMPSAGAADAPVFGGEVGGVSVASKLSLAPARPASETFPDCPHQELLALWAEVLPALPQHKPAYWRGARADHLRARWRYEAVERKWRDQAEGMAFFRKLFGYVGRSAFLAGRARPREGGRPFVCELDWLVQPQNFAKVIEGKYHAEEVAA